jgi:peptidoglycan/xylan/chitin deacetylase (PgdA/CDA1 family)
MSYDDGSEHDRRLVHIFNKYGIRGTFNLNSGRLGATSGIISREEVRTLYQGHEIASHSRNHPELSTLSSDEIRLQIRTDKESLEELSGYSIRGFAYPFGTYNLRIADIVRELGIEYARTISDSMHFNLPRNLLALSPTCHHNVAMEMGKRLVESESPDIEAMVVWGHSYELDGFMSSDSTKNWDYIEEFAHMMHNDQSIWFATTIELVDYVRALQEL